MIDRLDIYERLGDALERRSRESLDAAARRMVRLRGHQIAAAKIVLGGNETGDAAWVRLARALDAADACPWPGGYR